MLTHGVINAQLAQALAGLRHKDRFVVSDAGLPVQPGIEVIDLAVALVCRDSSRCWMPLPPNWYLKRG